MSDVEGARVPGVLPVADGVKAALAALRAAGGNSEAAELDIDAVRNTERAIGMRLGDDLLATFAAAAPATAQDREMRLQLVMGHTGALRERGAPGDLIGVGREDRDTFLCVALGERPEQTELIRFDVSTKKSERHSLAEFLVAECARVGAAPASGVTFEARLVPRLLESQKGVRVRHKVFGEGRVLTETGKGPERKVKVDFQSAGLKLLQARFLEYLD